MKVVELLQAARYEAGVRRFDFDQGLAPYDLTSYGQWRSLSHHISKKVRRHFTSLCVCILQMLPSDVAAFSVPVACQPQFMYKGEW